jgi:riboflavin biosynthesis pyrimidine reductase
MKPLERLYEADASSGGELPGELARLYDGELVFDRASVYANFVTSLDGVVALPSIEASPSVISGKSEADRFVMALLRAHCDAVLIGAGTLRAEPEHRWTPAYIYPDAAGDLAELRRRLDLPPDPELFVVTASGELDPGIPALVGATVITSPRGARRLHGSRDFPARVVEVGEEGSLDIRDAIEAVRAGGRERVLSEGGPTIVGQLLGQSVLNELFLTLSPALFGRPLHEIRPALVEGADLFDGEQPIGARLVSLRRHGDHLFTRHAVEGRRPNGQGRRSA